MTLFEGKAQSSYEILMVETNLEDARSIRLRQLGFIAGAHCFFNLRAPIIKTPILVEIRGMKIALSKEEAELIKVKPL